MGEIVLGISAFYHDSAAALLRDGEIVAAAQEERFTRKKHDDRYPRHAIDYCYREAGITSRDLAHVVFYDKPLSKFERLMDSYLASAPRGVASFLRAMPIWLKDKIWLAHEIGKRERWDGEVLFAEHHESHAASAFFPSPFEEAVVLTMDGVGEWTTTSIAHGRGRHLEFLEEMRFPHSLGLLYSAFTYYTGFKVNSGEYKVMGLAPYGEPRYVQTILDEVVDLRDDGSFGLNLDYFEFHRGLTMTGARFERLFGGPPRAPESPMTQREMDLARSIQDVTELIVGRMVQHAVRRTSCRALCLAGGVALNCVANGKDLGPRSTRGEVHGFLDSVGAVYETLPAEEIVPRVARLLADGKVVGWHRGRMEFGPRALGARSILGDPRSPAMQRTMNLKVKYRESFRPFAPAVLLEDVGRYFEHAGPSPYMLLVADVQPERRIRMTPEEERLFGIEKLNVPRSDIPAVTHVDYSARIQTVDGRWNPDFHALLQEFKRLTGCAVLVNTSFNVRGEPIVMSPRDSYLCFMRTEMDSLLIEDCLLHKSAQPPLRDDCDWRSQYQLD